MEVYATSYSPEIRSAWDLTEAIMQKFKARTESAGSKLPPFYIPSTAEVYAEDWVATKRLYGIKKEDNWNVSQVTIEFSAMCQRNGIACIDPTKDFRVEAEKLMEKGSRLYFVEDQHWNALGHKLSGEILAKHVLSNNRGESKGGTPMVLRRRDRVAAS